MALETQERYLAALDKKYIIGRQEARIVTQDTAVCFKCGGHSYWARDCEEVHMQRSRKEESSKYMTLQERFKKKQEGNITYAEALKRNRSQSRGRSQGRRPTPLGWEKVVAP